MWSSIYFYQLIFSLFCFVVAVIAHLFITTLIKAIIGEHNEMKEKTDTHIRTHIYGMSIELMAMWQGAIAIIVPNSRNV